MGFHIDSEDFLAAFELMEGKDCLAHSLRSSSSMSIRLARQKFKMICKRDVKNFDITICGRGGWHRYYVIDESGMVYFSLHHCSIMEYARNARDLGFDLFGRVTSDILVDRFDDGKRRKNCSFERLD